MRWISWATCAGGASDRAEVGFASSGLGAGGRLLEAESLG